MINYTIYIENIMKTYKIELKSTENFDSDESYEIHNTMFKSYGISKIQWIGKESKWVSSSKTQDVVMKWLITCSEQQLTMVLLKTGGIFENVV